MGVQLISNQQYPSITLTPHDESLGLYKQLFSPQPENRSGRPTGSMEKPRNADGFMAANSLFDNDSLSIRWLSGSEIRPTRHPLTIHGRRFGVSFDLRTSRWKCQSPMEALQQSVVVEVVQKLGLTKAIGLRRHKAWVKRKVRKTTRALAAEKSRL
jgi:hypothetical protein